MLANLSGERFPGRVPPPFSTLSPPLSSNLATGDAIFAGVAGTPTADGVARRTHPTDICRRADGPSLEVRVQQKYTQAVALARQALRHSRLPLDLPHDDAEDGEDGEGGEVPPSPPPMHGGRGGCLTPPSRRNPWGHSISGGDRVTSPGFK